jgi:heptosyltransferase-2
MTEPLLRRLQARGERLTVGALPHIAPVYAAMPQVAQVVEFPFRHGELQWALRRAIALRLRGRFDRAYVLPNSIKSALIPFLAGVPQRIGYRGELRFGLLTHRLANPSKSERPPMVGFYSRLSDAPPAACASDRPRLSLGADQLTQGLIELGQAMGMPGPVVRGGFHVFATGAEYGPAKRWPTQHWADLAARLHKPVLLLGSGKEAPGCQDIVDAAGAHGHNLYNLAGKTSLNTAFAAIAAAESVVTNDSGLMHVAAALDVPQVAIFGSSSPEHTPPLSAAAAVIWLKQDAGLQPPLDCAPCFQRECPKPAGPQHLRCLLEITPERVASKLTTATATGSQERFAR